MDICHTIRDQLADLATADAGTAELSGSAREHLAACPACRAVAAALPRLEELLGRLPAIDAADGLVTRTAVRVAAEEPPASAGDPPRGAPRVRSASGWRRWPSLALGGAAAAALIVVVFAWPSRGPRDFGSATTGVSDGPWPMSEVVVVDQAERKTAEDDAAQHDTAQHDTAQQKGELANAEEERPERPDQSQVAGGARDFRTQTVQPGSPPAAPRRNAAKPDAAKQVMPIDLSVPLPSLPLSKDARERADRDGLQRRAEQLQDESASLYGLGDLTEKAQGHKKRPSAVGRVGAAADPASNRAPRFAASSAEGSAVDTLAVRDSVRDASIPDAGSYQEASGYWANTYVPGDPTLRLLEARLRKEPVEFLRPDGAPYRLEALARQYRQPFDPPQDAALAVFVHADRKYVAGPTRMLLQVGLQGTQRKSGLRPAMNIGVVLDLTADPSREHGATMRALLQALAAMQQTGDRFSLTVAGCPGAELVSPEEFRRGPLTVALARLFAGEVTGADMANRAPTLGLVEAIAQTMAGVSQGDDPSSSLGASAVLLVTAHRIDDRSLDAIERLAHTSAVGGIPLSVIGVGGAVDEDQIDTLVLAGQGNRRLIHTADEAAQLIDRELHAVSRVVARAVRLRIRLGSKVRLVEMLGSRRLDAAGSDRVREAERSVDLRLARNLGIEADRGDDEEGMQIVIPSYYAGDSHVFLLDVVMDGPGQLADVTVRYKDLVFLRNGVARANRTLGSLQAVAGPLEHNVLKNWLALGLADAIHAAGLQIGAGDVAAARATLAAQERRLDRLRGDVQGWWNDPELLNDSAMLAEYQAVLHSDDAKGWDQLQALADSLQYAGRTKVQARLR